MKNKMRKGFQSGLIVSGNLPDRKKKREKNFASGLIFQATCPMVKTTERNFIIIFLNFFFKSGLIVMGDLPRKRKGKGLIVMGDLPNKGSGDLPKKEKKRLKWTS